ncbi:putative organic solute transporter subunit alpha [Apostichopus japonicus]|uniref:Putative organic solute transporter subunit alpha n=1 Tax=Stichopus japonicus TaxID=307972 RepID=A0A2G8JTU6_STIJA|nr:putative organic solute transporter subunit alpha [Apostichopus japonicus]
MTSMLLEGTETPLPLATINWVFNVSDPDCPTTDPSSAEVWQDVQENVALKVGFAILTAGTIILFVSFLEACVFIARKIPHGEEATSLVWIIGIYPVSENRDPIVGGSLSEKSEYCPQNQLKRTEYKRA